MSNKKILNILREELEYVFTRPEQKHAKISTNAVGNGKKNGGTPPTI